MTVNVCPSMNLMHTGVSSSALNLIHANMAVNDAPWTVHRRNAVLAVEAMEAAAVGAVAPCLVPPPSLPMTRKPLTIRL